MLLRSSCKALGLALLLVLVGWSQVDAKTLRVNINADPSQIDPITYSELNSYQVLEQIYEGFTAITPDGRAVPALAGLAPARRRLDDQGRWGGAPKTPSLREKMLAAAPAVDRSCAAESAWRRGAVEGGQEARQGIILACGGFEGGAPRHAAP